MQDLLLEILGLHILEGNLVKKAVFLISVGSAITILGYMNTNANLGIFGRAKIINNWELIKFESLFLSPMGVLCGSTIYVTNLTRSF